MRQAGDKSTGKSNRSDGKSSSDTNLRASHEASVEAFIKRVGNRVFEERRQQGMSRRVLSELSGVSQRTIVLLETGVGNISISLLYRVSSALGQSVKSLMDSENEQQQHAERVANYYLSATPLRQQKVLALLDTEDHRKIKQKRLCLIGLRGAGKSTLGAMYGDRTGTHFVELNGEIESLCGMSVQELMSLYGQEGYRQLEQQALRNIAEQHDDVIVAAAGGVVTDEDTYAFLLKHFHAIWLKTTPEEHIRRVKDQGDERPMAGNPEAMSVLRSILTDREDHYRMADCLINTSGQSVETSLDELQHAAKKLLPLK